MSNAQIIKFLEDILEVVKYPNETEANTRFKAEALLGTLINLLEMEG